MTGDVSRIEDSDFVKLGGSDIESEDWNEDFDETHAMSTEQGTSLAPQPPNPNPHASDIKYIENTYIPSHTSYSRAKHAAEQEEMNSRASQASVGELQMGYSRRAGPQVRFPPLVQLQKTHS